MQRFLSPTANPTMIGPPVWTIISGFVATLGTPHVRWALEEVTSSCSSLNASWLNVLASSIPQSRSIATLCDSATAVISTVSLTVSTC